MKHILLVLIGFCLVTTLSAQTNKLVNELEGRRLELQRQITASENLLKKTSDDVNSQLNALNALTAQIEERKRYITAINNDIFMIDRELSSIEKQLAELEKELSGKKKSYAASVQFLHKNKSVEEKLMFIFSAKDLNQTYRRMRYVREYATYQRLQGEEILGKQKQINSKKWELQEVRDAQASLMVERDQERKKLEEQEKEQKTLIANLQNQQKKLQEEINKKIKEADKLNERIESLIDEEIARSRKEAEERLAGRDVKPEEEGILDFELEAPEPTRKEDKPSTSASGKNTTRPSSSSGSRTTTASKGYILNKEERALSGSFVGNRGNLPVPVTGPYLIANRYGRYRVEGLRNVRLDNRGIDIQAQSGSEARAVFNGEVTGIFVVDGLLNVMVRHGNYISVYCNLSSTHIKKGDQVKTGQKLGKIFSDPNSDNATILHFQLRKETQQLNPEPWLRK